MNLLRWRRKLDIGQNKKTTIMYMFFRTEKFEYYYDVEEFLTPNSSIQQNEDEDQ